MKTRCVLKYLFYDKHEKKEIPFSLTPTSSWKIVTCSRVRPLMKFTKTELPSLTRADHVPFSNSSVNNFRETSVGTCVSARARTPARDKPFIVKFIGTQIIYRRRLSISLPATLSPLFHLPHPRSFSFSSSFASKVPLSSSLINLFHYLLANSASIRLNFLLLAFKAEAGVTLAL